MTKHIIEKLEEILYLIKKEGHTKFIQKDTLANTVYFVTLLKNGVYELYYNDGEQQELVNTYHLQKFRSEESINHYLLNELERYVKQFNNGYKAFQKQRYKDK